MHDFRELGDLGRRLGKPHHLVTGRATTALYLLLESHGVRGRSIVLPVNLCYSIVNAITMSGNRPVFVDVDPLHGNTTVEAVRAAAADDAWGVLLPHQYGNPVPDTTAIGALCRERGLSLIEDCAAGFDATVGGEGIGSFGDYTLLSFGARKTVDATIGGALLAREPIDDARRLDQELPLHTRRITELTELYSTLYRTIYHSGHYDELDRHLSAFNAPFEEIYRYRLRPEEVTRIDRALAGYAANRRRRLLARETYDRELSSDGRLTVYPFATDAVPWRYNLLFDEPASRAGAIRALLGRGVRVSAWYPPVHRLFGDGGDYPNASRFAERVLNLPVDVEPDEVREVCRTVRCGIENRDD
jgi:dTDP-4-amino-4,6-dideoxygalactose transaminase